ncbi:LamG domain-containing protein [Solwaraspora sp. WMMD1047]|uniref:LamG-like jellyroll fold domain-containing protein n=1 Tax=Solwaraspora sp. WMMD1047 TaxID=3016102 RepID=UPI002417D887|nr:LamG-like jellyroll fold domain-containing protein [Solwaraspora sp. WMMD1047]MDG4832086.1 LamG domain-containing protein [Solwaraspora sp. WMMD1047]
MTGSARRLATVLILALALGLGIPPGAVPADRHPTSFSWLWNWLSTRPSWAFNDPPTPAQERGRAPDRGHYVEAAKAPAGGTAKPAKGELDRYEPHRPTSRSVNTGEADTGFDPTTSERIASAASEKSDVYQNPDGSYTRRVHRDPVNYRAADGTFKPIDSTLRFGRDGRPRVAANSFDLSFAGRATTVPRKSAQISGDSATPAGESGDLVRVTLGDGRELAFTLSGATVGTPAVDGEITRYANVFPDVDLELGAMASGVKEVLTLRSAQVPTEYVYPLRLTGLTARIGAGGAVEFVGDDGKVVVAMPVGYLEDAAVDATGAGAMSHAVRYEIIEADGAPALKVSIDGAWLRDPARKFPVVLDPTATIATTNSDTYVQSGSSEPDRSTETNVAVGTFDGGGGKAKSLIPFPTFGTTFAGKRLSAADLNLFMSYQGVGTGCVARRFDVHRVTSTWSYSTVKYATFPTYTTSIGNASPSNTNACNNVSAVRNVGTWVSVALNVAQVNEWVTGASNFGLALTASETDSMAWKRFTSANPNLTCNHGTYGAIQCDPFIDITYSDNVAPQVTARYPENNYTVSTLTPELAAQGSDPDNWPAKGLRFNFLIYNDQGTQITTSGWVPGGVWKVPPGVLAWGKTYLYAVQVNDYSSTGPPAPVTYAFSTQVPQPAVTSSLAQNGGKGYEASVGNYTTSDSDAEVATAGPALSITRDYNSLDTRADSAFGRGWSSLLDMRAREDRDGAGVLQTATIRYPDGQEVAFGRNNDGTWVPPSGRFSVFKAITGGYSLTDKDATGYEFTQPGGTGVFRLTKITDASGRALTLRYDTNGRVDQLRSVASNRTLTIAWSTPAGADHPHVATVTTDPVTAGDPGSALTWNYEYDTDLLDRVCPPGTSTECASYDYTPTAQHASTVLNSAPYSFWRLNEPAGATVAQSGVLSNDGGDAGILENVTLGQPPVHPESTSASATFNGTSAKVRLPAKAIANAAYQSVSMWFKTSTPTGVLFSYQKDAVNPGATTTGGYAPALYVDSQGKLRGQFWNGNAASTLVSPGTVTDDQWHHVALSGNGGSQRLYLDGAEVGVLNGAITLTSLGSTNSYIGAGFLGGAWPAQPHTTPTATFFNGSIADVAFYNHAISGTTASSLHASGRFATPVMSQVTSNAGRVRAQVQYDTVSGRVSQVTDENGGSWQIAAPTTSGSSQVYVSTVLGSRPRDYYRLGDIEGPAEAANEVVGNRAYYNNVTFNTAQPNTTSPFADTYGAGFNGTSSFVRMQGWGVVPFEGPHSIEMWFKVPANHAQSGVLYSYQDSAVNGGSPTTGAYVPALYVGSDGYLRGGMWTGARGSITSTVKVNDGNWHHVVLSATYQNGQRLYLDNKLVGTRAGALVPTFSELGYIGAGTTLNWAGSSRNVSYFTGNIAEFAYYNEALTEAAVDAHYKASRSALPPPAGVTGPVLTPVTTATVTDPTGKPIKQMFDLANGNRLIAQTDALGNTTSYGFDVGGFVSVEYDPLGRKTELGKDVRGNTIRSTTCRHHGGEVGDECQTSYYRYWPDATTVNLTPDARNDQLIEMVDARGTSETDPAYRTRLTYDTAGNRTSMVTPPVPGHPNGRTTTMTYTTASTPAVGGGVTPPGLPMTTTSARGSLQRTDYNAAGDAVRVTDPAGLVTEFGYDGLGRVATKKVISTAYPAGQVTSYAYDADGEVTETVEPPVTNRITGAVHTARTTDVFDADGLVTERTVADTTGGDSARTATSAYDAYGRMIKSVDPAGGVTLLEYDVYGNQTKAVSCDSDPDPGDPCPTGDVLRVLEDEYDAEGHLLTSHLTGADGTRTRLTFNAYYADGTLASETDAMNWTTRYLYNADGTLRTVTRTDGVKTHIVEENLYDRAGNLSSRTENNGATNTQHIHDAAGRLQASRVVVNDVPRTTRYSYDADDRVVATRDTVGDNETVLRTVENTYDPMGRVTSESISSNAASRPAGWWKLDETSEPENFFTAHDSSPSQQDAYGYLGASLGGGVGTFSTGTLETGGPVLNTTQSYSVSAWLRVNNLTAYHTAVGQGGNNHGAFFLQYNRGANKWAFTSPSSDSTSPSAYRMATANLAPAVNTWVHLVGVFDANTKVMSIYANNVAGVSATNATPFNSTTPLSIGGNRYANGGGDTFVGQIDNVQVYQRAISAAEVSTLYGGGNGRTSNATLSVNQLTTNYTVDDRGLTTAMVDPKGNRTDYEYDEAGQLVQQLDPAVSTEVFGGGAPLPIRPVSKLGYNTFGEEVESQDPLGNITQVRVDALGRPWQTIQPDYTPPGGTPIVGANTTVTYDKLGQVTATTDQRGKTTTYEYDSFGNAVKVIDPAGKFSTATYSPVGDLLETVDPTGAKSTATYDYLGRQVTTSQVVRQPTPQVNTTQYDYGTGVYGDTALAGPWLQKVTSPDNVVTSITNNVLGERVAVRDGANNTTNIEYDGLGRVSRVVNPDQSRRLFSYDGAGRTVQVENRDQNNAVVTTEKAAYDENGNLVASTDARQTTTTFGYDALNNLTSEVQPITATTAISTSFGYDAAGNRTRFTDGRNNAFWTTYNSWGLPESQIEPATAAHPDLADRTWTAVYDRAARPVAQLAPGGVRIDNEYDDRHRLMGQTGSGAEATTTARTFDYDDAGRLTSFSAPNGTHSITYDDRGLPLTIDSPGNPMAFGYTRDGRMASRTDAAGTTGYTYDVAGRLRTASNPTTGIDLTIGYNAMSLPSTITYGTNNNVRTLTYDALQRLRTDTLRTANGATTLGSITYGYDENSNLTSKVTTGFAGASSNTYGYDLADRLTSWTRGSTVTAYAYDGSGNRTQAGSKTFTYDARNRLTGQTGVGTYAYTPRGTLRQTIVGSVGYETTADAFGQVISQQAAGGNSTYEYDALGRAVQPEFRYTGLGNTLAQDATATYTRGPGGELLGQGAGSGAGSVYAWTDLHLDVVGQFTATGTALAGSTSYDPLGTALASSGMVGSLGYQSEWTDTETGRVNMHARWYNPDTGQFDTRDTASNSPVPDSVAANRFQYGDANPMTTIDPTGHWGIKSFLKKTVRVVTNPVATYKAVASKATSAFKYVSSGRAWKDVKSTAKKTWTKAKKAAKVVKDSTVRWAKKKVNTVKDAYKSAKKCVSGGVGKCVKETAKKAVKKVATTVKSTVEAIKKDPWKFVATAAVGLAAAVAVGALCATGVGCLIVAGAVAGAMSAGAGYMVDVSRGDEEFSWSGLAGTMIEGGLDGALSAGLSRLGGGRLPSIGGGRGTPGGRSPAAASAGPSARSSYTGGSPGGGTSAARPGSSGGGGSSTPARPPKAEESRTSGPGCPRHSFDPATPVLLADGSARPIGDLTVGDEVVATDPETGETSAEPVTRLHVNIDRELTNVTVREAGSDRTVTLETTAHHPFWDATERQWVDAGKLQVGHRLLVHDDKRLEGDGTGAGVGGGGPGPEVTVVAVDNFTGSEVMRDLTVATHHTYYVIAGDAPVLVHNCVVKWRNADDSRFPNRQVDTSDQDPFPNSAAVRSSNDSGAGSLKDGDHHFVIMPTGEVRSALNADIEDAFDNNIWPGHTSLAGRDANGDPNAVIMAGRFTVQNGRISRYDNWSGHYQPQQYGNRALQDIAKRAFTDAGYAGRRMRFTQY